MQENARARMLVIIKSSLGTKAQLSPIVINRQLSTGRGDFAVFSCLLIIPLCNTEKWKRYVSVHSLVTLVITLVFF
jgi:hypothetical protein